MRRAEREDGAVNRQVASLRRIPEQMSAMILGGEIRRPEGAPTDTWTLDFALDGHTLMAAGCSPRHQASSVSPSVQVQARSDAVVRGTHHMGLEAFRIVAVNHEDAGSAHAVLLGAV